MGTVFDPVIRPAHYTEGRDHEPADVIQDWQLNFFLGNTVKYISRAGRKPGADVIQDLEKARWYLDREISNRRANAADAAKPIHPSSTDTYVGIAFSAVEQKCAPCVSVKDSSTTNENEIDGWRHRV